MGKDAIVYGVNREGYSEEVTVETWMKGRSRSRDDLWQECSGQRKKQVQRPLGGNHLGEFEQQPEFQCDWQSCGG